MLPSQATLKQLPLHKVLLTCYQTQQSGLLVVQRDEIKKIVLLEKGNPKGCRSNIKQETLGYILMEEGVITEEVLKKVLKDCKDNDGMMLGTALVTKKMLDPERLMKVLEQQLIQRLYDLFTWEDGAIKLHPPTGKSAPEAIRLPLKTPTVVLQGLMYAIERSGAKGMARAKETSCPQWIQGASFKLEDFEIRGNGLAFLRKVDSKTSIGSMLADGKFKREEAISLLLALETLGLLTLADAAPIAAAAPVVSTSTGSTAAASAASVPAGNDFGASVSRRLREMEGKNFFEVLGVARDANDADVRKVYFKLAKDYHPDKLRNLPSDVARKDGEVLFAKISEAYNTLMDVKKRQEYVASLSLGGDDATEKATKILESEAIFQRARGLLRQGEMRKSREMLEQAIALYDEEPEYQLYYGWCLYKGAVADKNTAQMNKGKQLIEKHKDSRKRLEVGYYFLGEIAVLEGNSKLAIQHFNAALEINPKSHEAERQLRLIEMRGSKEKDKDKKEGGKGFMGVFKKDSK